MALNLVHQTKAQFIEKLREEYRDSIDGNTTLISQRMLDLIAAGDLTDAEMQTAFGMNAGQWTVMKLKLEDYRTAHGKVKDAKGE